MKNCIKENHVALIFATIVIISAILFFQLVVYAEPVYGIEVGRGKNYINVDNGDGTFTWTSAPEYVQNDSGQWVDSTYIDDGTRIIVENALSPFLINKADCTLETYDFISIQNNIPVLGTLVSIESFDWYFQKGSDQPLTGVWNPVVSNDDSCQVGTITQDGSGLFIPLSKTDVSTGETQSIIIKKIDGQRAKEDFKFTRGIDSKYEEKFALFHKTISKLGSAETSDQIYEKSAGTINEKEKDGSIKSSSSKYTISKSNFQDFIISYDIGTDDFYRQYFAEAVDKFTDVVIQIENNELITLARYMDDDRILLQNDFIEIDPTFGYNAEADSDQVKTTSATGASCPTATGGTLGTFNSMFVGTQSPASYCQRLQIEWDISSLPTNIDVTNVNFRFDVISKNGENNCDYMPMATDDISTLSVEDAWTDIGDGTPYLSNDSTCLTVTENNVVDLGTSADSDIETARASSVDEFAIGIKFNDEARLTGGGNHKQISFATAGHLEELEITYTTTPNLPTGLGATAQSDTQINLSWTAPSDNGGSAITGYKIWRESPISGGFSPLVRDTGDTDVTYSDTGLTKGTQYNYKVAGRNANGIGTNSTADDDTTFEEPNSPTALSATTQSQTQIDLSWTAPSDNGGTAITGYKIWRESPTGNGFSTLVADTGSSATTYSDTSLNPVTQYNYKVAGINSVGLGTNSTADSDITTGYYKPTIPRFYEFDGTTVVPSAEIHLENSTGRFSCSTNSTGQCKDFYKMSGSQNFTFYDTDNYKVKELINYNSGANPSYDLWDNTNKTDIFDVDCADSGSGNDFEIVVNGTFGHHITSIGTPVCTSSNTIYTTITWTADGKNTNYYKSLFKIRSLNTTHFGNAHDVLINSTSIDTTLASGSITSDPWGIGTGQETRTSLQLAIPLIYLPDIPTALQCIGVSGTQINCEWNAPTNAGNGTISDYNYQRDQGCDGTFEVSGSVGSSATSFSDVGLISSTCYSYKFNTENEIGVSNGYSASNSGTTLEGGGGGSGSGGGGGGGGTKTVIETIASDFFNLSIFGNSHVAELGQTFGNRELEINWETDKDITIKSIVYDEAPFDFTFSNPPFILKGDPSGVSSGILYYSLAIPAKKCNEIQTNDCVYPKKYEVLINMEIEHEGVTFPRSSTITIDLGNEISYVSVGIAFLVSLIVGGYAMNKIKSHRRQKGRRRQVSDGHYKGRGEKIKIRR